MRAFIQSHLGASEEEARALQKHYFHNHGSTLRGLMVEHDVPPQDFLKVAHNVDLAGIAPDPRLREAISALPGRCLIFTSATVAHAENILSHLGIADLFEDIFDIHVVHQLAHLGIHRFHRPALLFQPRVGRGYDREQCHR